MELLREIFQKEFTKRLLVLGFLILVFYLGKSMLNMFLLTFLFTYLIYSFHKFLYEKVKKYIYLNETLFIALIYLVIIGFFVIVIGKFAPSIINETVDIINELMGFKINYYSSSIGKYIDLFFQQVDIKSYAKDGTSLLLKIATNIGKWSINIFVAILLSMFFMFERKSISGFMKKFETSKVSGFYKYMKIFGENFTNSFGKVIQIQIVIALLNTALSVIALSFMDFPQIAGLGLMIFGLGLIPVAGTIVSLVPLSIIAYQIGGIIKIIYVLAMVAVLHSLESYVLNPRFMSVKTKLPVFFTLIVLLVSEHFMKIWGLLVGIPLFIFFLDLLNVKSSNENIKPLKDDTINIDDEMQVR
jgi:predicted PurR-regulated permease PerM